MKTITIRPQPGTQERMLDCSADIVIVGGDVGSAKTFGTLLACVRYVTEVKGFGAVFFKKNATEFGLEGGILDEAKDMFGKIDGSRFVGSPNPLFTFEPYGNKIGFRHLQYDHTKYSYKGMQTPVIIFDELDHQKMDTFMYLITRSRSRFSGVDHQVFGTLNPGPGWVPEKLIPWWIDETTGRSIPERYGVLRYFFVGRSGALIWGDSKAGLVEKYGEVEDIKETDITSITFFRAKLEENKILLKNNPNYMATIRALPIVEQERLLYDNWTIKFEAGMVKLAWFERYDTRPVNPLMIIQSWDTASSDKITSAYSVCGTWFITAKGYYLVDVQRFKALVPDLCPKALSIAQKWKPSLILIENKSSGETLIPWMKKFSRFAIFPVNPTRGTGTGTGLKAKIERLSRESPAIESGRVFLPKVAEWLPEYETELANFPETKFMDQVDMTSQTLAYLRVHGVGNKKYSSVAAIDKGLYGG